MHLLSPQAEFLLLTEAIPRYNKCFSSKWTINFDVEYRSKVVKKPQAPCQIHKRSRQYMSHNVLAFDLGASNGRAVLGQFDGEKLQTVDIHRFPNDPVRVQQRLHWDI